MNEKPRVCIAVGDHGGECKAEKGTEEAKEVGSYVWSRTSMKRRDETGGDRMPECLVCSLARSSRCLTHSPS
jgi:hypothetical protein